LDKRFFPWTKCSGRPCGPPCFLFTGYRSYNSQGVKLIAHLNLRDG